MDIVSRLKKYMEFVGLPSTQFADYANIPRPTISQILNGRNRKISNELITKLHVAFPNLSIMWLMFGDGEMEVNPNIKISERQKMPDLFSSISQQAANDSSRNTGGATQNSPAPADPPRLNMRSSSLDEFVDETPHTRITVESTQNQDVIPIPSGASKDTERQIQTIMVFYNDNSYQIFSPSK